jgi:hypothetical protein
MRLLNGLELLVWYKLNLELLLLLRTKPLVQEPNLEEPRQVPLGMLKHLASELLLLVTLLVAPS